MTWALAGLAAGYTLGRWGPIRRLRIWVRWGVGDVPSKPRQVFVFALLALIEPIWFWKAVRLAHLHRSGKPPEPELAPAPKLNPKWARLLDEDGEGDARDAPDGTKEASDG